MPSTILIGIEFGQKFMLKPFHEEAAITFLDLNLDKD
jgi:hypothetical protein